MTKTIIGLTGNIATGKSAVLRFAAEQRAHVIDADKKVHEIMNTDGAIQAKVVEAFGEDVRGANGGINRALLGRKVFGQPDEMAKLEAILHPAVRAKIKAEVEASSAAVVMIEAIKLLDGPLGELCDAVWVTNCGKFRQLQRLIVARGMNEDEAFTRIMSQDPQADKVAKADLVIDTTGSLADTLKQVATAWGNIGKEAPVGEAAAPVATEAPISEPEVPEPAQGAEDEDDGGAPEAAADVDVIVRRARPSDIPSIMLLIHKATDGKVKPKRAEILMSLSERGYLIGQIDSEISTVAGWYTDKGFAAIERFYVHPPEAMGTTGKAVLGEIGKTANELMCEAVFAFLDEHMGDDLRAQLVKEEYLTEGDGEWPRVWKQALKEMQPEGLDVMTKKLWNARVA